MTFFVTAGFADENRPWSRTTLAQSAVEQVIFAADAEWRESASRNRH